jgi:hypothetical protein
MRAVLSYNDYVSCLIPEKPRTPTGSARMKQQDTYYNAKLDTMMTRFQELPSDLLFFS